MNANDSKRLSMHLAVDRQDQSALEHMETIRELANLAIDNVKDSSAVYRSGHVPIHMIADGILENALKFHIYVRTFEENNPWVDWERCWLSDPRSRDLQTDSLERG